MQALIVNDYDSLATNLFHCLNIFLVERITYDLPPMIGPPVS